MIYLIVTFCFWLPSFVLAQQVPTASRQYCKRFLHHFWEDFILSTNLQQERVWINVNYKSSIWCNQEIRNSNCGRLMAALVQSHTFSVCNHSHLSVGHTHEDVDPVLSVVKRALDSEPVLLTPRDFMRAINKKLEPLFEQQGMTFKTFWVEQEPLAVKLWKRITFCSIHRPKKQNSMLSFTVVFKVLPFPICVHFSLCDFRNFCFAERIIYNHFLQQGTWLGEHTSAISLIVECLQGSQAQEEWGGDESSTIIYIYGPRRPDRNSRNCFWENIGLD